MSYNLKSDDTFVILGPNGLGSFKTWLIEYLFFSSILVFNKGFLEFLTDLSRDMYGLTLAQD